MEHLMPVLVVSAIVAFFMYKNINKITANIDKFEDKSYELYAKYARVVEGYIKDLQNTVEKNSVLQDKKYLLKDGVDIEDVEDELSSLIRKLAFFETLQAKNKSTKELEGEFYEILSSLDDLILESFENGKDLADEIRENLHKEYSRLKENLV